MNSWTDNLPSQTPLSSDSLASWDGEQSLLAALQEHRILVVSGPDAGKFLQGQVTCDTAELDRSISRLGGHCNHKGRMISSFRAARLSQDSIGLRLSHDTLANLHASLAKYIVFSKAELESDSDHYAIFGLAGRRAADLLQGIFGQAPNEPNQVLMIEQGLLIHTDEQRFELWLEPQYAPSLWQQLSAQAQVIDSSGWDLLSIRAGIGEVRDGNSGELIPQMLNYQAIDGISFNKGCYTGQEVVARMQYLGKLKRHMYAISVTLAEQQTPPKVGADLYSRSTAQSIGKLIFCAPAGTEASTGNRHYEALASITTVAMKADDVFLDSSHKYPCKILPLPYTIDDAESPEQ